MIDLALDTKGITLAEIEYKYPKVFQTLGYDVLFDTDSAYKPKVISTFQLCINTIITLLLMRPGQYPSIPELGIDIESYLYEYSDDPTILNEIKSKLSDQCNRLDIIGLTIDCYFDKLSDGTDAMCIEVTGTEELAYGATSNRVIIGITKDQLDRTYVRTHFLTNTNHTKVG